MNKMKLEDILEELKFIQDASSQASYALQDAHKRYFYSGKESGIAYAIKLLEKLTGDEDVKD